MSVSATAVKELREKTGAGIMDCKAALSESAGDVDKAVDILRKCRTEQPMIVLMEVAGRSDRTKFRNQVLGPLLAEGLLELAIPDKPRSSKQRYRITAFGAATLKRIARKA